MLHDFHVVPKMMNDQTVQVLVNMAAMSNTEKSNQPVVLSYSSKHDLNAKRRKKRPQLIENIKVKDNSDNKANGSKKNNGIRRRPSSGGNSRGGGGTTKNITPTIHNIDFYEFVDVLGRISIVSYKLNPGVIKHA
jgi:hypothetical protein